MAKTPKDWNDKAERIRAAAAAMGYAKFGKPGPSANPRPPIGDTGQPRTFSADGGLTAATIGTALALGAASAVGGRIASSLYDRFEKRQARAARSAGGKGGGRGGAGRG